MCLDRALGDVELGGDHFVRLPRGNPSQYFDLALAQCIFTRVLSDLHRDLRRYPALTRVHRSNGLDQFLSDQVLEQISRSAGFARVWPDLVVEEGSLRFHIAALRKVLGEGQSGARYVINVAGRGYCFAAPILRSAAKPPPAESPGAERIATLPHQRHDAGASAALPGDIAHEFNDIIGAILGYGELAQNAASADDQMRCYVDNILIAGRRAKSLVERLLATRSNNI